MIKIKCQIIAIASFFFLIPSVYSLSFDNDGQEEKMEIQTEITDPGESATVEPQMHDMRQEAIPFSTNPNPGISDFPSKHPMIVHFPIVLLIVAFFTQIFSFFIWKKELGAVTLVLLAGGAIGSYIASNFAHPHTSELNEVAAQLLTLHEDYAAYAKWSSIVALVLKTISYFFLKRKLWGEIIVALILAGSAYTVGQAGHYGAALTHLHGIGVEGKYLENATHQNGH